MSDIPYVTICVGGDDATEFLQGQLTADVRDFADGDLHLTAWCNPKGRVICIMTARQDGENFDLTLPGELAEHVVQRLKMFRFRAKVEFEARPAANDDLGINGDFDTWRLARLRAGIPEVFGPQSEQFTSHMLNLDLLNAVSLDKGCYTGQEIIARTHYRGASKRRLHHFTTDVQVSPGDKVSSGERIVGEVVNAIGCDLLAVVQTDSLTERLTVGGATLTDPSRSD